MCPWYYDNSVKIVYSNPFKVEILKKDMTSLLGDDFYYDLVLVSYGKPADIAKYFSEGTRRKFGHWISLHGSVVYDNWGNGVLNSVDGIQVGPITEESPLLTTDGKFNSKPNSWNPKLDRMILTEQSLREVVPDATIMRVGGVYGPYDLFPNMYTAVRRIVDKRPFIILPERLAGVFGSGWCYSRNQAEMIILAIDQPNKSKGETFNVAEDRTVTVRQWVQICADALGSDIEIIEMPYEIAVPGYPIVGGTGGVEQPYSSNLKAKKLLGYEDVVHVVDAISETAKYLAENPPDDVVISNLQDPCDYENEDKLVELWRKRDYKACMEMKWPKPYGFGHFYYGPKYNPGDGDVAGDMEAKYAGKYDPFKLKRVTTSSSKL